jgi:hypothetical protein
VVETPVPAGAMPKCRWERCPRPDHFGGAAYIADTNDDRDEDLVVGVRCWRTWSLLLLVDHPHCPET